MPLIIVLRSEILPAMLFLFLSAIAAGGQETPNENLARSARATVSSASGDTTPQNLTDGDIARTHWTAKDGTNPADTWVELNWTGVVHFKEVLIRQEGDQKLSHLDLETRDPGGQWRLLQSIGDSQHLLPRLILVQFAAESATGLRLSRFTGQVSFNEIEVYNRIDPPVVVLASDLLNHIFGIVTDGFGTMPMANVPVRFQGTVAGEPWRTAAQTDEAGMFQVEMPVGLEGSLSATAQLPDGSSPTATVQAGDLSPGLSLPDETTPMLDLTGSWRFKPDPAPDFFQTNVSDSGWKDIKVPAHWIMEGFDSSTGTGGYRRQVQIPASFRGRRIKLLFDGVYSGAEVWLNGNRVGSHEGGFSPFELDITSAAHVGGENILAVLVREKTLSSRLDGMSSYANFPLAGIFRPVHLFSVPEIHVRRFHAQTFFDSNNLDANNKTSIDRDATLTLDFTVENESGHEVKHVPLLFSLRDPSGQSIPLANEHLDINLAPWSRVEQRLEFRVVSPRHWEAEHPLLYTLSAKLSAAGSGEIVSRRVGFRQVEIRGTDLLINGVPLKLRGVGYFEADPLAGRAIAPDVARRDLKMMKEANLDAFRTEVILPAESVYDNADDLGLYVEAESPFCWVDESSDLRFLPTFVQRTAEILDRDRSHPSIIIWSVGNESTWGPDFEAAHQFVKKHDPTRPTSAGQSAALDLDTMHNPISLARMKEREDEKVPIIWDESFCIFQGDLWGDTREMWLDPGDRDYYIDPLIPVWDAVQTSKNVQGSMIWAWVDDIFLVPGRDSEYGRGGIGNPEHGLDGIYHISGRGIVGDAPWGIVDGWRRKKPEFWHVKMLMSPVHFHERDLRAWKPGEPAIFTVDNRYEFTNLSELSVEWADGEQHGTLHPDIAPHTTGKISIPVGPTTKPGDFLSLKFVDTNGQLVTPHRTELGIAPTLNSTSASNTVPLRYLHEAFWLGGPLERFIGTNSAGDNFEIAVDSANGRIRRALVSRHSVLYGTPKLHVLPIEATLSEFPMFESWRITKPLEIRSAGDDYEVIETGAYRDFAGELRFRISPQGSLLVSYDFTYTGTDTRAREVGLQFGVPLWCDKLQWRRQGEWTVYPEDHIGRNDGVAVAHASVGQTVPPNQSFALDDTPIGTNDFRSSKRNFIFASLTDKEGYGVGIEAIGAQHLRTSVANDLIEVNVNDWFGGTGAAAWGEWWQNYGQGLDIRSDDPNQGVAHNKLSGSMELYLLSPRNSDTWLQGMQSIPTLAEPK